MKVRWTGLGIVGMALVLTSCSKKEEPTYQTIPPKPCIVSTGLPDSTMGRLGIQMIQIGNNVRVIIPTDGIFRDRGTEIKTSAYPALNDIAVFLSQYPNRRMVVTGHTDELGTFARDQRLSEHQAQSLITYLWTLGIPHECLTPIGIGKDENFTVASNRSLNGKAANRRLEINFRV